MTLFEKVKQARAVFVVGNGGSYANAMHICNDFILAGKPAFCLDPASLTALANDFGYAHVFSRWLAVVGRPGDLLIALSGSGTSPNITRAIEMAETMGLETHLQTDYLKTLDMQASEEAQLRVGHDLMRALRDPS